MRLLAPLREILFSNLLMPSSFMAVLSNFSVFLSEFVWDNWSSLFVSLTNRSSDSISKFELPFNNVAPILSGFSCIRPSCNPATYAVHIHIYVFNIDIYTHIHIYVLNIGNISLLNTISLNLLYVIYIAITSDITFEAFVYIFVYIV